VADTLGIDVESALSKALNKDWGGLGADLGKGLGGKIASGLGLDDALGDFGGLDGVMDKFHSIADSVKAIRGGDVSGGIGKGLGILGDLGLPGVGIGQSVLDTYTGAKGGASELATLAEGTGLGALISGAALPIAGTAATVGGVEAVGKSEAVQGNALGRAVFGDWRAGDKNSWVAPGSTLDELGGLFGFDPSGRRGKQAQAPESGVLGGTGATPDFYAKYGPQSSSTSTTANEVEVQARDAVISAGSVTLGGSISIPASMSAGTVRSSPAGGSGAAGTTGAVAPPAKSSGGGGFLGNAGRGYAGGGVLPGDSPGHDNILTSLGGSPLGLEGGEFIINPQSTQANMGLLQAINSGAHFDGGGGPLDPQNPSLAVPPTQGNQSGGPKQQQQLGSGSGAGISGGGIIGAAEQAGVAAAGIAGFGGGAIAAQIAEQETNLAIQKSSQMAAALATAPFETLGLQGGQMGAPTVNPMGGWIGKLIGGALGQQKNIPNMAGAVQPPKQPQQKDPTKPGEDPGNGQAPDGPAGTKDDPMHVNVTNPPQGAPQNGPTSAANLTASMATGIGAVA